MVEYYFDIETTGPDPRYHKVITVQFQKMAGTTGKLIGGLRIWKEWETSERTLLEGIMPRLLDERPFGFIMVGKNLLFDFMFLSERARVHGLEGLDLPRLYDRVFLDLKHVLVLINEGRFTGYSELLRQGDFLNEQVPELYRQQRYEAIVAYIQEEARILIEAYQVLKRELPSLATMLQGRPPSLRLDRR